MPSKKKDDAPALAPDGSAPSTVAPAPAPERPTSAEIKALEASIAADQARLTEFKAKRDFVEFPKMVKERTFGSREEQDAAGPDYADV